jgi:potassium-dependent mechanosensitive channel
MSAIVQNVFAEAAQFFSMSIQIGSSNLSIQNILLIVVLFCVSIYICRVFKRFLKHKLLVKLGIDASNRDAISTLLSYSLGVLCLIIFLQHLGIKLDSLAVIFGALGVGIGFGLQNIAKDLVSGCTILFERKIKVGDFVEFDGKLGHIKDIALRSTVIRTRDGGDIVVPNGYLVDREILNWTNESYLARIKVPILLSHGSDPLLVTEALINSAYMEPSVVREPAPKAMFRGFDAEGMKFELWAWVNAIDRDDHIKSSLYFILDYNLRMAGLEVPRPQRDLWVRNLDTISALMPSPKDEAMALSGRSRSVQLPALPSLGNLLKQVVYFENFSELQLRQLIEIGQRKKLQAEEVLFSENEPGDAFYIILSGSVEVRLDRIDKHLADLESGDFFGELALMLGIPRTATVRAKEETVLFAIDRLGFKTVLHESPEIYPILVTKLEERQAELSKYKAELQKLGLLERNEDETNPISWMQKRIKSLFNLSGTQFDNALQDKRLVFDRGSLA